MKDIYFETNYGKLYENMERGTCEVFEYRNPLGSIRHMFIKREIPIKVDGVVYYDLITPYGYGGPLILDCKSDGKDNLVGEFEIEFRRYCLENNIVSEFIRFHPLFDNATDFRNCYQIEYMRNTVGTNLRDYEDPLQSEFSKSARKSIRRALRAGIEYRVLERPNDLGDFKKIYYSTMDRKDASDFYYFADEYFAACLQYFRENIILVEAVYQDKIIAMGFYFIYHNLIHIHLSGTLSDYLKYSPAYILRYAIMEWGKKYGYDLIHYGGGITNSKDDSLYRFKKKFGKNTEFKFYVGRKIWNKEIYRRLCLVKKVNSGCDFFPAYRL